MKKFEMPFLSDSAKHAPTNRFEIDRREKIGSIAEQAELAIEDVYTLKTVVTDGGERSITGSIGGQLISLSKGHGNARGTVGHTSIEGEEANVLFHRLSDAATLRDEVDRAAIDKTLQMLNDYHDSVVVALKHGRLERSENATKAERGGKLPHCQAVPIVMQELEVSSSEAHDILTKYFTRFNYETGIIRSEWHHVATSNEHEEWDEEPYYNVEQIVALERLERVNPDWARDIKKYAWEQAILSLHRAKETPEKPFWTREEDETKERIRHYADQTGLDAQEIRSLYENMPTRTKRIEQNSDAVAKLLQGIAKNEG